VKRKGGPVVCVKDRGICVLVGKVVSDQGCEVELIQKQVVSYGQVGSAGAG